MRATTPRRGPRNRRPAPRTADRRILPLAVAAFTFLAFVPVLQNDFVDWDDTDTLTGNPFFRGLGWPQLRWMWTTTLMGQYVPVTWMTFGLDYLVWGMDPRGYHLTSLLLHVANACLFYLVVARLLATGAGDGGRGDARGIRLGAAFAALLFGVHPLRVESVAWATERRDVLCGFFVLLSLLAYLRHAQTSADGPGPRRAWYWVALGCFGAAVLSKPMAVTLPAILLILDVYPLSRLGARPRSWLGPAGVRVWTEKLPFLLVSAAASVMAISANRGNLASVAELGVTERVAVSAYQVAFYLWKAIAPVRLAPLYELPTPLAVLSWPFALGAVVVLAVTSVALVTRRSRPGIAAAWLASLIMLGPVSAVFHNGPQIAADRYTYLPALPWAVLAGAALSLGWRASRRRSGLVPTLGLAGPVVVVVILGALTWTQTQTWRDSERLWTHALAVAPSSVAHYNLGVHFDGQGRRDLAIEHYRRSLQIKPDYAEAHYNWGVSLARQGRWDAAIERYRDALRIKPDHAEAHYNWGLSLARQGEWNEAIAHYERALRIRPEFAAAHNNWGNALVRQGRWSEALHHYREALRIRPDHAEAHNNLGSALAQQGLRDEAITHYRRALEIRPDFAEARSNLDRLLAYRPAPR